MKLSNTAFWDVDRSSLDEERHADFIIRKVFNFGLFSDIIEVLNRYPEERIIRSLTTAPWLEKKTLTFACNIFNLKPPDFRCTLKNAVSPACFALLENLSAGNIMSGFALAGGTSLALRIGHRVSIDLDFFNEYSFNSEELLNRITQNFSNYTVLALEHNTLNMVIEDVKVQFLGHLYPVLAPYEQVDGVKHYSFEDITAMKLNAIAGRGDKKDFWDFNFLLEKFSAVQALDFFKAKYRQFDVAHVVKSLAYFNDAELQPDPTMIKPVSWEAVKENILTAEQEIVDHYRRPD